METRVQINDEISTDKPHKVVKVEVLYFDLTNFSARNQFLICSAAVFVLYLLYGYLQELIFTLEGFKPYGWYLTLVQFAFYSIFGYIETFCIKSHVRKIPIRIYGFLAFLTLGTMGFSNSSISYLNYPTQVIFKCCKLIPVMIGSILIQRKHYGLMDFLAALSMCAGLSIFTLGDSKVSPNFNTLGVIMICCALLCDAVIGNVQEKYMKYYGASTQEVVLYSYAIGFVYLLVIMVLTGNLAESVVVTMKMPIVYSYALLFSLTGYLGMQVVLTLVTTCGALVAVTVTTFRKALSIILSFIFFYKPFTPQYVWGGLLVLLGIYLNVLAKSKIRFAPWFSSVALLRIFSGSVKRRMRGYQKHTQMTV